MMLANSTTILFSPTLFNKNNTNRFQTVNVFNKKSILHLSYLQEFIIKVCIQIDIF